MCEDGVKLILPHGGEVGEKQLPMRAMRNGITHVTATCKDGTTQPLLIVLASGTAFNRGINWIIRGGRRTRTVIFPYTITRVGPPAFCGVKALVSAVLNEGLTILGTIQPRNHKFGAFWDSGLKRVRLPSRLTIIG